MEQKEEQVTQHSHCVLPLLSLTAHHPDQPPTWSVADEFSQQNATNQSFCGPSCSTPTAVSKQRVMWYTYQNQGGSGCPWHVDLQSSFPLLSLSSSKVNHVVIV
ncbi:expressed unknown protein [Seminavis robusta]|uniref:Uncharacterized protein n=1 Tax=Seminavis robusta TaxID=568900 RepID=A0A9N8H3C5_9STRA|nr:expressed unknown protein [Seminavis robusta]|eukprot:Sro57_g033121.1  (104) ;mRNA; f:11488-11799